MKFTGVGKFCSFCGEPWSQQRRFAGGFGAQICGECIHRYADLFSTKEKLAAATRPPWNEMDSEQMLDSLKHIVTTSEQVEEFLYDWVGLLRDRGVSWQEIGLALGVSRQAAWERFTRAKRALARDVEQA